MATDADVKSLLHFDGADGQLSATDYGHAPKGWIFRGTAAVNTALSVFGGASAEFDGLGGLGPAWIEATSTDFAAPSGLFSIELRVRFYGSFVTTPQDVFGQANPVGGDLAFRLHKNAAGQLVFSCPGLPTLTFAGPPSDTWASISIDGDGTTLRAFKNGALMASGAYVGTVGTSASKFALGRCGEYGAYPLSGSIDEFRFTESGVWHTAAYTPDAAAFTDPTTGHTAGEATGLAGTNFGVAHAVFDYGSTPVVVLQDDFRASGALVGSSATAKFSDLSSWLGSPASRSSSGLSINAVGTNPVCYVESTTSVRGPGVFTVQAKGFGLSGHLTYFGASRYAAIVAQSTGFLVVVGHEATAGRYEVLGSSTHGWADATTLRLEFDLTNVRAYADNTLLSTDPFPQTAADIVTKISVRSGPMPSGATVFSKYITVATNTTSGPLGALDLPQYFAASIGEVTHFGTPALPGFATGELLATQFGLAYGGILNYAAPIGLVTNFGTPLQTPNKSLAAGSLAPATVFGEVESVRDFAPEPVGRVTWLAPGTFFGTASVTGAIALTATGIPPNELPAPTSRMVLAATGALVPTNFGTPNVGFSGRASGTKSTAFGTPTTLRPFETAGFARTTFGSPSVRIGTAHAATGWLSSNIGAASALASAQRTRSGVFRTRFGLAQAERFAP